MINIQVQGGGHNVRNMNIPYKENHISEQANDLLIHLNMH